MIIKITSNMLNNSELKLRHAAIQELLVAQQASAIIISSNVNLFYTTGLVISGFVYIPQVGEAQFFVRRPVGISGATYIRKFEDIAQYLPQDSLTSPIMMECESASFSEISRFRKLFSGELMNGSALMRQVRSIKSEYEREQMRISGAKHSQVYSSVASLFKKGMSDIDLSIEIERELRLNGSLGIFRIAGGSMELFVGSLLAGDNADNPSPYDFAMGGAGSHGSLPVGANGTKIEGNMSVMVDFGGNFTGYMSDMTRIFSHGDIGELAHRAHQCSIDICRAIEAVAKEGVSAAQLYNLAATMVSDAGLDKYFMGHTQKAPFVGHGIGLEINELPVLAPKSRDTLTEGMVFALEPKFVIPGIGAVGIENSYIVCKDSLECITLAPENIISL